MKAYAIKHKDGKFWQFLHNNESDFVDGIYNAFFHYSKQDAEKTIVSFGLKNCKVVEITMEEVNQNLTPTNYDNLSIEDKLKYRENQVRIALDRDVEYDNKITELEFAIKRLEEELAKKDKMIGIACGELVDFEYEQKESVHSAQFWKERLETLAKQELEKEEL